MISTKRINSVAARVPASTNACIHANVLTWHPETHCNGSKWHVFSPYYLKTDGDEENSNEGGVIFENFWQGSKVWPTVYDCQVWAHPNLRRTGNTKHLWFEYTCAGGRGSERHLTDLKIQDCYYVWRAAIFSCTKPVRYPNGAQRAKDVAFSLLIDRDTGKESRLDYLEARSRLYVQEYARLARQLPEFGQLVEFLKRPGASLVIYEVDVPNQRNLTLAQLDKMLNDPSIRFGHGLVLARELLLEAAADSVVWPGAC